MPKDHNTPRDELVCGKLDQLALRMQLAGDVTALDLIHAIRHDCERMEQKLISRKQEAKAHEKLLEGFWNALDWSYSIETREWFEARLAGFGNPLMQALHHIWKREPKVRGAFADGYEQGHEDTEAGEYCGEGSGRHAALVYSEKMNFPWKVPELPFPEKDFP